MHKGTTITNIILFWLGLGIAVVAALNNSTSGTTLGVGLLLASVIDQGLAEIKAAINSKAG